MEGLVVRDMTPADLAEVLAIAEQSFSTPWGIHSFNNELENKDAVLKVALIGGQLVGYACIRTLLDITHVMDIAVLTDYRQQGIGGRLLQEALKTVRHVRTDVRHVTLEVRASNHAAVRLYTKYGFSVHGKRKDYYQKPVEDALIMGLSVRA